MEVFLNEHLCILNSFQNREMEILYILNGFQNTGMEIYIF